MKRTCLRAASSASTAHCGIQSRSAADFHVIRNAGGRVDESAIRSLVISQRLLGTTEIFVIHHTGAATPHNLLKPALVENFCMVLSCAAHILATKALLASYTWPQLTLCAIT